jgi:hypothetical protein
MFILGIMITAGWLFCFFYYGEVFPRQIMVATLIAGLFSMGYGLLTSRN